MKRLLKDILTKSGLLYKIQFMHWYRQWQRPSYRQKIKTLFALYDQVLPPRKGLRIFDIGANQGDYSYVFSKYAQCLLIVEPDLVNQQILTSRFGSHSNCVIIPKAVSSACGKARFHVLSKGNALNSLSEKWMSSVQNRESRHFRSGEQVKETIEVETTTLDALIDQHGKPDYVKIDVEGLEKEVITGLGQTVSLLSFECNLPDFKEETLWIISHLHQLNPNVQFNYVRDKGLELDQSMAAVPFKQFVENTSLRFMEIFCFNE